MPFSTDNVIEMMMAINSFGPRFDPQSIPSYNDWLADHTFDPFGAEPFSPSSNTDPGTPFHSQPKGEFRAEEDANVGIRVDRGHGSSGDIAQFFPQERSRFKFAQERIERTVDRPQIPVLTKATVPRVVGPRPPRFQRGSFARREPPLAIPKAMYSLPTWLTRFEDYEDELVAEFCPPSGESTPPILTTLFGSLDSGSGSAGGEVSGGYSEGDEDFEDYESCRSDTCSDFGSESFTPAICWAGNTIAFDWPAPYQSLRVTDGKGYSRAGGVTPDEFSPEESPSLSWSGFTNPFADGPTTSSPAPSSTTSFSMCDFAAEDLPGALADRRLAEMEEGLGHKSGSSSGSPRNPSEGEEDGWYTRFDLTGSTPPILPRQSWSLRVAVKLDPPPVMYPATIPLPDIEEDLEDVELGAIVISPRSPGFDWRR